MIGIAGAVALVGIIDAREAVKALIVANKFQKDKAFSALFAKNYELR